MCNLLSGFGPSLEAWARAAQPFVPLGAGLIIAGISLGLGFNGHRSGAVEAR